MWERLKVSVNNSRKGREQRRNRKECTYVREQDTDAQRAGEQAQRRNGLLCQRL